MKSLLAGLPLLMIAAPSAAQWQSLPEIVRIEGKGEGAWTLTCQMQPKKGAPVMREFVGRGKRRLASQWTNQTVVLALTPPRPTSR